MQLSSEAVKRLDELAARSGMSRHRYMIVILERAIAAEVVVKKKLAFSDEV